jgi:pyruvate formate lyase activating enzyme
VTARATQPLTAVVLEIQRMSTEDGPGLRTTVFFKGCSLRCTWCHNPESLSPRPQLQWVDSRCIGCKLCLKTCPNGALTATANGITIDRARCVGCGMCTRECPSTALGLFGQTWTVDDLLAEVRKDQAFFEKSRGGVTASGGEATLQPAFVEAFFRGLRAAGVHTALDTCGQCAPSVLEQLLPYVDLLLFDLKEIDSARHREFTGSDNRRIFDNLQLVARWRTAHRVPSGLWIRTPIIPGATDRADNIRGLGQFIATHLRGLVDRWELCAFNNLCRDKYARLDVDWPFRDAELLTKDLMDQLAGIARRSGVDPAIVHWSGSTRLDESAAEPSPPRPRRRGAAC